MKRFISIVLTVAMCATMMLVPTVASAAIKSSFTWDNGTANGGLAGKAADEYATLRTISSYNGSGGGMGAKSWPLTIGASNYSFSDSDYFVLDINVLPKSGVVGVYTCANGGLYSIGSKNIMADRWNHVRIVVEEKTADEMVAAGTYQPLTLYVNGELVGTKAATIATSDKLINSSGTNDCGNGFRFNVGGDNGGQVYVADAVVSESKVNEAPVMPVVAAGENYVVNADKTITFADDAGVTVQDIKDANPDADIRAFWSDKYASQLSNDHKLTKGNVVVIKSSDNIYNYYTVNSGVKATVLAENTDGTNMGSGKILLPQSYATASAVNGIGGKQADDTVYLLKSKNGDSFIQYTWGTAKAMDPIPTNVLDYDWDKKIGSYTGYLVLEYSVYNVDCPVLQVKTDYGGIVVPDFGSYVPKNRWSRVRIILDRTAITTNTTYYTVYVDGKQVSSGSSTTLGALYSSGKRARNNIRLGITSSSADVECTAYVDDIRIYETDGFMGEESINIDDGVVYDVVDDTIHYSYGYGKDNAIGAINYGTNNAKFNLFDANGNVVSDAQSATILGVWGKSATAVQCGYTYNDMYRYYTLTEAPEKYELLTSTPDFANNKGTTETADGEVFGVTSGTAKKVTVGNANNFHNLTWQSCKPASQYLVYTVDVAPVSGDKKISKLFFGTNEHKNISAEVNVGMHINEDEWNKLTLIYDLANNTSDLYINGTCISADYKSQYVKGTHNCIRFIIFGATGAQCYVDNMHAYETTPMKKPVISTPVTGTYSADTGATYVADCGYGTLVVASFNGENMIEAKYINVTSEQNSITLKSEGATQYKAFIWNNMTDIRPMYNLSVLPAAN